MEENKIIVSTDVVAGFKLPRYSEIPDVGLYLEQTTKYINSLITPIGFEITSSMIRNYVKMGLLDNPVHKLYYRGQIAHLICIAILKSVISLENISTLFEHQQKVYSDSVAYDYFCKKLENMLYYQFGLTDTVDKIGNTVTIEKNMLRSAIIAVSHITYLKTCFKKLDNEQK